jgi:hypothetical protein
MHRGVHVPLEGDHDDRAGESVPGPGRLHRHRDVDTDKDYSEGSDDVAVRSTSSPARRPEVMAPST